MTCFFDGPGMDGKMTTFKEVAAEKDAYLRPPEAGELLGRQDVEDHLAVLLAGQSAETLVFPGQGPTCGIQTDLHQATLLAQSAVGAWGLDNVFPLLAWDALPAGAQQAMANPFLERVQAWIHAAELRARKELGTHEAALRILSERLATQETLHRPEILSILVDA